MVLCILHILLLVEWYSMLGSLSCVGELDKLFIVLFSEGSTQNKQGHFTSFLFWHLLKFSKFADKQYFVTIVVVINKYFCALIASSLFYRARIR